MNWYYDQGGQRQGPVSESELEGLIAAGTITENTLVWREGMAGWEPLKVARPSAAGGVPAAGEAPAGWVRCTATGRYFPPEQIVYIGGKPYSAEAKPAVLQGVMQGGVLPVVSELDRTGPPWEQRAQLGLVTAAWQTIKAVLTQPGATFERMQREGGLGSPLLYNVILGTIGSLAGLSYQFLFNIGGQSFLPPEAGQVSPALQTGIGAGIIAVIAVLMPVFVMIATFIGAGVLHLSLMICGGAKQPFETTLRTYCYAGGSVSILQIVPVCGGVVSGIWGLVCMCIGISKTHEITTGRAVLAVLLPSIVCCVLVIFLGAAIFSAVFAAQGIHPR